MLSRAIPAMETRFCRIDISVRVLSAKEFSEISAKKLILPLVTRKIKS